VLKNHKIQFLITWLDASIFGLWLSRGKGSTLTLPSPHRGEGKIGVFSFKIFVISTVSFDLDGGLYLPYPLLTKEG